MALFTRSLGSPNEMTITDLCQGTTGTADPLTFGDVITIYRSAEDFPNSKCILLAGTNPPHSCTGQWQDISYAMRRGAKLIVVDPRRSEAGRPANGATTVSASTPIPPRPPASPGKWNSRPWEPGIGDRQDAL